MEIIIQPTREQVSKLGAKYVAQLIRQKPNAVLGLATGSTPLALYAELVRLHRETGLDFSQVTTFNLDEYLGLPPVHPASYHHFMWENLFQHLNVNPKRVFIPRGDLEDEEVAEYCESYEVEIQRAGGIDLQILGIGGDGHIGFNEPSSSLASRTRIKTLTERTRADNASFFNSTETVPQHVITMGIGTILEAREVLLLAFGVSKAEAVAASVEGPIASFVPASSLQLHRRARFLLDEAAASKLIRQDYYRWVYDQKPTWQNP